MGGSGEFDDGTKRASYYKKGKTDREDGDFFEVEDEKGEKFLSVRPWLGAISEPTNHNSANPGKPDCSYELEYVYGYRSQDSRQNVYFNQAGEAVYMTACLGVILDPATNTQKFFGGGEVNDERRGEQNDQDMHNDDILGLEISPDRSFALTCQRGPKPTCFTWDAATGEKKMRFTLPKGSRGINCCSISGCGKFMACVD